MITASVAILTKLFPIIAHAYGRPNADITDGSWVNEAGSNVNLYASISEESANDSTYVRSGALNAGGAADSMEVSFSSLSDPGSSGNHSISYRYQRWGQNQVDLVVKVMQGGTEIASWTHTNIPQSLTEATQLLTGPQADSITNYGDLRVRFIASSP